MDKKILWIDDDYYSIQGLLRPIEKDGYKVDVALSALEGYQKAQKWQEYDLIVVDLILPISREESAPDLVLSWDNQEQYPYVGIGLAEWLLKEVKADCPVVILSVIPDPITVHNLGELGLAGSVRKSGLLPASLKDELLEILKNRS